jgi:hypothetical protein
VPRRRKNEASPPRPEPSPPPEAEAAPGARPSGTLTALLVVLLLGLHYAAAVDSLRRENPTVDEVLHLPAGISYWQKRTFRLYPHNPPLPKLVAALPVVLAGPETLGLYEQPSWTTDPPDKTNFGHTFAFLNAGRYFELFDLARMVMPLFSVVGGLFVFAWSGRLYGRAGGLLSLALWCICPNVLAHARLVTGDVAGASMAVGATFLFWRYLRRPTWSRAALAGVMLGLAELTKFSLLLLYAYWPLLWLARSLIERDFAGLPRRLGRDALHALAIVAISVLVIDIGYGFERVGRPLDSFEFASRSLTRPLTKAEAAKPRPRSRNRLFEMAWQHRVNRFRGTWLGAVPVPLPYYFLQGFDEQRIETEGIPAIWENPNAPPDEVLGYPVYLDGELRQTGWWYYYLACLAYKVPEGTWLAVLASMGALAMARRDRAGWFDEFAVLAFPATVLVAMTAFTDINLGVRYILPVFPFVFVATGKLVPWVASLAGRGRVAGLVALGTALGLTAAQTALIHPHYLASFNWVSGGPGRGSRHLIDSNLDWGQDLVGLRRWLDANRPGCRVGLAYFGQINPSLFHLRRQDFPWFLPPALPRRMGLLPGLAPNGLVGPASTLRPGVYAVSASLVRGLPWRIYDPGALPKAWSPAWSATMGAFAYFAELTPSATVGYSIFIYEVTEADCARINPRLTAPAP